jgi:hypothetical protein
VPLAITSFVGKRAALPVPVGPDHGRDRDRHAAADRATLILQKRILAGLTAGAVKG